MSIREIIKMGNPILRREAEKIDECEFGSESLLELIQDLRDSMKHYQGIGIAAPQIGVSKQVCLIHINKEQLRYPNIKESKEYIIINPTITILDSKEQGNWEGCLSLPGLRGFVQRPGHIKVDFFTEFGKQESLEIKDFLAIVFQHELDHLFGKLYVDHIKDTKLLTFESEFHFFTGD